METQISVRALATLSRDEMQAPTKALLMKSHRRELLRQLQGLGFERVEFPGEEPSFARRFAEKAPHLPDIIAVREGRAACLCLPPLPKQLLGLEPLSPEQCACCESEYADHDVYYAALFLNPQDASLLLLEPVPVRRKGQWLARETEQAQFLPPSRRAGLDRYSAVMGGAAIFKLNRLLIPHTLERGTLPRFTVRGLFDDREQGENACYALMSGGAVPAFLMLVEKEPTSKRLEFRRPFFFYGERPHAELELTRCAEAPAGLVEMLDKTGRMLWAECLESILYPAQLATGRHYQWTLSLTADRCRRLKREFELTSGPMYEQIRREYVQKNKQEPPADFAVRVSTEQMRVFFQEPQQTYAELCGKVTQVEALEAYGQKLHLVSLLPLSQNDDVEVQVFVHASVLPTPPQVGDVLECTGFLYASPDEVLEDTESWQDSGEVAALQEKRELQASSMRAYHQFSSYSLAQGIAAEALAKAGYSLLVAPGAHTREEATFVVESADKRPFLIFVDTLIRGEAPQFLYTEEQRESILRRNRAIYGEALSAHLCTVNLSRVEGSENYDVQLQLEPEMPGIDPEKAICEATQCPPPGELSEAQACRIVCNAICSQDWTPFARNAAEDMEYTSHVNGTHTLGKMEHIRYMSERKQLWEEQMGWPGMQMDTGSVLYKGERRPSFMITCYGNRIGAAIVSLRGGLIASIETLPLEVNDSFEPDAACTEAPRLFHPLRGHLYAYTTQQSPLQRFATAYLQECMMHKTGILAPEEASQGGFTEGYGVQFRLQKKGARWLKLIRNGPSFCDLAFTYAGRIYAICAVETADVPADAEDIRSIVERMPERQLLLDMAEKHGFIPCVFPATRGYTPDPEGTWNLWDIRTMESVHPEVARDEASAPPSDWEVLNATLAELSVLVNRANGRVLASHDRPSLLPHFWFYDARGQLCWIIVRTHANGAHVDRSANEEERQILQHTPGTRGYVVDAEAWGDAGHTLPARSGATLHIRLSEPLPLE